MTLPELINKIHLEESFGWAEYIENAPKQEGQELSEKINSILKCTDIEQFSEWLINFCGDDPMIIINYLITYLVE